jgi:hypothetical protein
MTQEALKLALEALLHAYHEDEAHPRTLEAITAIKEALAQPEQEPVAIVHRNEYNEYRLEPHDNFDIKSIPFNIDVPLFKSPQRTWVGLTDEEIAHGWKESWVTEQAWQSAVWWAEAKLKEKNT